MNITNNIVTKTPDLYEITHKVEQVVEKSSIQEGICVVSIKVATAGIIMAANDKLVHKDIMQDIERIFPPRTNYKGKDAPVITVANVVSALYARPLNLTIYAGKLLLGKEQGIFIIDTIGNKEIDYNITCL